MSAKLLGALGEVLLLIRAVQGITPGSCCCCPAEQQHAPQSHRRTCHQSPPRVGSTRRRAPRLHRCHTNFPSDDKPHENPLDVDRQCSAVAREHVGRPRPPAPCGPLYPRSARQSSLRVVAAVQRIALPQARARRGSRSSCVRFWAQRSRTILCHLLVRYGTRCRRRRRAGRVRCIHGYNVVILFRVCRAGFLRHPRPVRRVLGSCRSERV